MRRVVLPWVVVLLAGCPPEPELADYDATCQLDADCVAVRDQQFCGACDRLGALSADGADAFLDDQEAHARVRRCREIILPGCPILDEDAAEPACSGAGLCFLR